MNVYIQLFMTYLTQYRYLIPSFLLVIAGNNICRKHRCIIRDLQLQNTELKEKIKVLENPKTIIPKDIVFSFGKGPIRYFSDNKYYHGIGADETDKKWYKNNGGDVWNQCIIQRVPEKKLQAIYDTHNAAEYCTNCVVHEKLSNRKRVYKVFTCMGHEIE